ncbi:MAG: hypothetical protein P8Y42_21070, partial [Exilibacterium sp.]
HIVDWAGLGQNHIVDWAGLGQNHIIDWAGLGQNHIIDWAGPTWRYKELSPEALVSFRFLIPLIATDNTHIAQYILQVGNYVPR